MLHVPAPVLVTAEALPLGRVGDGSTATAMVDSTFDEMRLNPFVHAVVSRLVAPVAAVQGWADPARWLRAVLTTFEAQALTEPARACRRVHKLLDAGATPLIHAPQADPRRAIDFYGQRVLPPTHP